jgi:methylmalonyl-CoA mutase
MARNTQLILREEAQVWHPSDAAGGSYYVEWLTARLARAGWELFQKLEKMGGMVAALREGYPQRETKACASRQKENVAKRERILVGVNRYTHPKAREGGAGQAETETGGDSLSTVESIPPLRLAADFERLGSAIKAEYPEGVSILLLLLGTASDHKAPAEFAGEFFAAAGLETETAAITAGDAERIDSVLEKDPDILVFCTSPGRYVNEGRPLIRNIRREKPRIRIVVVGNPESARGDFPEEGVEAIIHEGVDVPRVVSVLLAAPGGRS